MEEKVQATGIIDSVEALEARMAEMRKAQAIFATYSQEQVDKIFKAAATAADKARIPLAKMAAEETGMGLVEDKVIKNHYAAEYIYNAFRNTKTCGVIEEDPVYGIKKVAEPIGLIAAVIPRIRVQRTARSPQQRSSLTRLSQLAHRKVSSAGSTFRPSPSHRPS